MNLRKTNMKSTNTPNNAAQEPIKQHNGNTQHAKQGIVPLQQSAFLASASTTGSWKQKPNASLNMSSKTKHPYFTQAKVLSNTGNAQKHVTNSDFERDINMVAG